jgi:hypothetical protein
LAISWQAAVAEIQEPHAKGCGYLRQKENARRFIWRILRPASSYFPYFFRNICNKWKIRPPIEGDMTEKFPLINTVRQGRPVVQKQKEQHLTMEAKNE